MERPQIPQFDRTDRIAGLLFLLCFVVSLFFLFLHWQLAINSPMLKVAYGFAAWPTWVVMALIWCGACNQVWSKP